MDPTIISPWSDNWLWSLPLIVLTVVLHSYGLRVIDLRVSRVLLANKADRLPESVSTFIVGAAVLGATLLHGVEGAIWASAYSLLGALPDRKSAILYSLSALTSYGHVNMYLETHWQLMGALEALNGWILFGLTGAFLLTVIRRVWPHRGQFV